MQQDTAPRFVSLDPAFDKVIGPSALVRLLHRDPQGRPLFHEAGVYLATDRCIYLTSNRMPSKSYSQKINVVRIDLDALDAKGIEAALTVVDEDDMPRDLAMPNGGTPYFDGKVLLCEQGRHCENAEGNGSIESALVSLSHKDMRTNVELDSFQGKPFSSLNDAIVHEQSGAVFFTDPDYGVEQNFKKDDKEYAPNGLYIWQPLTGKVELLDDRYSKPNGVTFVPDKTQPGKGTLITTETSQFRFQRDASAAMGSRFYEDREKGGACLFAYPIEPSSEGRGGLPQVGERRLFAKSRSGIPDGVHPDDLGNLWAGHGDGVHVYGPDGRLIGKVLLEKGVANFCWAGPGPEKGTFRLLLFAEEELYEATVAVNGRD